MTDPRFDKAVIAMCVHDDGGALGIGLGRIMPRIGFHSLLEQPGLDKGVAPDVAIHHGGPVEPQRGFILHTPAWGGDGRVQLADRWVLTAPLDSLRAIAGGRGPTRWVVAPGSAGGGRGQREAEMWRN